MSSVVDGLERKWHALYTKPRWEKKLAETLSRKNIEVWCPLQKVLKQWSDRKKMVEEPLFKSYLFVNIVDCEKVKVLQTDGVLNFVHYLGKPAIIKNEEIEVIKSYLNDESVRLTITSATDFSKDMRVRIDKGLFMNNIGTIVHVNKKKILVNLESLGQVMIVEFSADHVVPA